MNINIILGVLLQFLKANRDSLKQQKISKESKPYIITLDHSCHFDTLNLNKYTSIVRENIVEFIEGKSELHIDAILAIDNFEAFNDIIYQKRITTFPSNDAQIVIRLLNMLATMLGYNKLVMIEFTFPRKNIFEIKISKKKGMLAKNEIENVVEKLIDFLTLIKNSLFANRCILSDTEGVIINYYINNLPLAYCEFLQCFIDQRMPELKTSFSFDLQSSNTEAVHRMKDNQVNAMNELVARDSPQLKSNLSSASQMLNQYEKSPMFYSTEVYRMQIKGEEAIKKFFGTEMPLLLYDYNLFLSVDNFFGNLPIKSKLWENYKAMYDLSYLDAKEMIFFMMGKLHLSAEMFIKKWKISSQETFLYSLMSSMLLTQVQELKRKDLDSHYEIELKHLNLKLKSFVEKYCKERDNQIQASKIKRTQQEHAEITLYANSNVEEDLPELVEIAPDEKSAGKFTTFQEELTAAFITPVKPPQIKSSQIAEISKTLRSSINDKPFTLLEALAKLCDKQDADASNDNAKLKQVTIMEQAEPVALETQLHSCDECNLSMNRP